MGVTIGRNDPCPCGSGKKYKKCCLAKDEAWQRQPRTVSTLVEPALFAREWSSDDDSVQDLETEEAEVENEAAAEAPERHFRDYAQVDRSLPELSAEDRDRIEQWWAAVQPHFERRDSDAMLERTLTFLETHPALFAHLGLDEGFLFELGAELRRRGQAAAYVELLQRLRREQPRMYSFAFGYYDADLIEEFVVQNRLEDIPPCFSFFKQYPDSHPDQCHEIISLLAWRGLTAPLLELAEAVAVPMMTSRNVLNGSFALDWLIFHEYFPFLDAGDCSPASAESLKKNLEALPLPFPLTLKRQWLQRDLEMLLQSPATLELHHHKPRNEDFLTDLSWNFAGQLHARKGLGWIPARYLGERLLAYCYWNADKERDPFRFDERAAETCLVQTSRKLISVDTLRALSILQALAWFWEYLAADDVVSETARLLVFDSCRKLDEKLRRAVDSSDTALRLYPTFERLVATP